MLEAAIFGLPPLTEKEIVQRNAELDAKYRNLFSRVFECESRGDSRPRPGLTSTDRPREDPVIARMWELTGKPFAKDMEEQAQGSDKFRAVNCPREPEEGDGAPPASLSMTHTRQGQQTVTGNLQGGESVDKSVAIPNDIDEDLPVCASPCQSTGDSLL